MHPISPGSAVEIAHSAQNAALHRTASYRRKDRRASHSTQVFLGRTGIYVKLL